MDPTVESVQPPRGALLCEVGLAHAHQKLTAKPRVALCCHFFFFFFFGQSGSSLPTHSLTLNQKIEILHTHYIIPQSIFHPHAQAKQKAHIFSVDSYNMYAQVSEQEGRCVVCLPVGCMPRQRAWDGCG